MADPVDLFDEFATNTEAEEAGAWEEYAPGIKFLIARANNKAYSKRLTKAYDKNKRVLDAKGPASDAMSESIMIDVMAHTLLLGWSGDFKWQGKLMGAYSIENASAMLAVKDFRRWVAQKADDFDRYKLVQAADDTEK